MKPTTARSLVAALACLAFLSGCDSTREPLSNRAREVIDMGRVTLPNSGHQLHGYRLDNGMHHDHFVYILEDESGQVLAGTDSNQRDRSGKTSKNTTVSAKISVVPPAEGGIQLDLKLQCASVADCQDKLRRLEDSSR